MTIIGSASVQIHALDNLFQAEVKAAVEKIKDVSINVTADFNDSEAKAKLDDLRARAEANAINLRATADINAADDDIQHLRHKHDGENIKLDVQAATTDAAAQIAYTARDRTVGIYPVVNGAAMAQAKATLESLSGLNTLRTLKDMFAELSTGFDTATLRSVTLASGIMGLVSSLGWLTTTAFGAGEGIAQMVGFFALAPTLIGAVTTTLVANHLAWNNFGGALSDNVKTAQKALAQLPPNAREAAIEVKKLWDAIKRPVQTAFWDGMGTSLQDTLRKMSPVLTKGLDDTAKHLGKFSADVLGSFQQIADNKTLDTMFKNLSLALDALGVGIKPLFDALNKLGFVGSQYLPQFGKWMADLAIRFDNFITKAAAGGDIVRWIENAKAAMDDLWRIGDGTIGIFQGLTRALNKAGSEGLGGIADSLQKVETIVKGPVFQSQFAQIFNGALDGAHAFKEGLADFGKTLGNSSQTIGALFAISGGVVKELLDGISALIGTEGFQTGVVKAFGSIKNSINDLRPSFENTGRIIGDLMEISAAIFKNIAPVINNATTLVLTVLDKLKDGFIKISPVLMNFISTLITAFSGPITALATIIGDIASAFASLPGDVQTGIMALGLVLLLLPKITKAMADMREGMKLAADGSDKAKGRFQWLNDVGRYASTSVSEMNKAFSNLKYETAFGGLLAKDAATELKTAGSLAMSGFVGGVKSGIGALGFVAGEIGTAVSKTVTQAADGFRNGASTMGPAIKALGTSMLNGLKENFSPYSTYMRTVGEGIVNGFREGLSSLDTVGAGFDRIKQTITGMADHAKYNIGGIALAAGVAGPSIKAKISDAFDGAKESVRQFGALSTAYVKAAFESMVAETRPFRNTMGYVWDDFKAATIPMEVRVRDALTGITTAGQVVGDKFKAVGTSIAGVAEPVVTAVSRATSGALDVARTAAASLRDTTVAAAQNISGNFAPVGAAFSALGASAAEGAANMRTHLGNIGTGFANMARATEPAISAVGRVAGAIGSMGKAGLGLAVGGLVDALGGPWGIALMGATTLLSSFGAAQEETKRQVEGLSATMDKQTGAISLTTYKELATTLSKVPDKFLGIFSSGDSAFENARKMGLSAETLNKAVAGDETARRTYTKFIDDYNHAVQGGAGAWDEFAKANGLGNMSMEDAIYTMGDLQTAYDKNKANVEAAQKAVRDLADATGTNTTQAAILAANYDTLNSKTSTASDRFNALKANLDVLTGKQLSAADAQKSYQQSLADSAKSLENLNGTNKDQIKTLVDVKGQIDFTKQAGRDFHTVLEGQADAILKLGTTALDNAIKNGKSAGDAQKAATDAMTPAVTALATQLKNLGLEQPQIDAIMQSFGLMPKDLAMALHVEGKDQAVMDIATVKLAAQTFASGNYTGTLAALPDSAKNAIMDTFHLAKDTFANGNYEAVLKALDGTAGGRQAALAQILTYTGGDYNAFLKALADHGSIKQASAFIDGAAYDRTAVIRVVADAASVQSANDYIAVHTASGGGGHYADGGIVNGLGAQVFANGGFSNLSKAIMSRIPSFANGSERHVAQIARGRTPYRIWAEPETGGEAYIPLALSKRARSKQILEMVASQFGFGLVQMFADGGFSNHLGGGNAGPAISTPVNSSSVSANPTGPLVAVYPSAALDEEKVGNIAARSLWFSLQNR